MANYLRLISELNKAAACILAAEDCVLPTDSMKMMDSYVIGYLRCCRVVIQEAVKAIESSSTYKKTLKKKEPKEE